jgi:hypothetical protein
MFFRRGSGNFLGILGMRGLNTLQTAAVLRRKAARAVTCTASDHEGSTSNGRRVKKIGKKYGTQK